MPHSSAVPRPASEASASPRPSDSYVQSFARGLDVIRSFGDQAPVQTLSEVAARTGMTRAGARRILLTLQTLGYVESDGRQFHLTPRILDLGFAYLSSMPMWNLAEPAMYQLAERIGESCSAAVLDGDDIVYVLRVNSRKLMSTNLAIGSRLPALWTSLGRVLLADQDASSLQERLARTPRHAYTPNTTLADEGLLSILETVRRQGWSLVDQELEAGLISLAAPVHDRSGRVVAAVNISGQSHRTSAETLCKDLLPSLLEATQAISLQLRMRSL